MLMKYKDFKTMSNQEMKEVVGGTQPALICVCSGGNNATFVCGYSTPTGQDNCMNAAFNFVSDCPEQGAFTCSID
jgi:bacteriocin-like protein